MKIVKRNGRIVEYDAEKIRLAISKANAEVSEDSQISDMGLKMLSQNGG